MIRTLGSTILFTAGALLSGLAITARSVLALALVIVVTTLLCALWDAYADRWEPDPAAQARADYARNWNRHTR